MATPAVASQSPAQPVFALPTFTYNVDIIPLLDLVGRMVTELEESASADIATMLAADKARMLSWLAATSAWVDFATSQPEMDFPKTAGVAKWSLEGLTPVGAVQNPDVENLARILLIIHSEIANSESARGSQGIVAADAVRWRSYILKAQNYINIYMVAAKAPLDMPATSALDPTAMPATGNLAI